MLPEQLNRLSLEVEKKQNPDHGCQVQIIFVNSFKVRLKVLMYLLYSSRVVRKPAFCICENKDADQLRGNREADQHLCFRYTDGTMPLLPKSEISSL